MAQLTNKIAIPIILSSIFAIVVFMAFNYDQLNAGFFIVIFLLLVYVFSFSFASGRSLSSPVEKILEKAKELSQGNLSSRVYLETKDELSELAVAFNKIAEELQAIHEQEGNTEKSVNIKVKARTIELEETINALEQKVRNRTAELEKLLKQSDKLQAPLKK